MKKVFVDGEKKASDGRLIDPMNDDLPDFRLKIFQTLTTTIRKRVRI
jgi:hypothetical protein